VVAPFAGTNGSVKSTTQAIYEAWPESKDTKVLTCTTFLIYKNDTMNELPVHNFIFQNSSPALSKHLLSLGIGFCIPES
jgi:hypothetical protein